MGWLSDLIAGPAPAPAFTQDPARGAWEAWAGMGRAVADLETQINGAADALPPTAVVLARRITDDLRAVLGDDPDSLPAEVRISADAILTDYMPTTLGTYLDATRHAPSTAADVHLREQLDFIRDALDRTRTGLRENDMRAVETQAQFLRTKYTESDLA